MVQILILIGVIVLAYVFRKQIGALFIKGQKFIDKYTETSVKIQQAINMLDKKKKHFMNVHEQILIQIEKLKMACDEQFKFAMESGGYKVVALKDLDSKRYPNERIVEGKQYNVKSFGKDDMKYYILEGLKTEWSVNLFDVVSDDKYMKRNQQVVTLIAKYESRLKQIKDAVRNIKKQKTSFERDMKYIETVETLIEIQQIDEDITANVDNITAEIKAVEKQLEFVEELNDVKLEDVPETK